MSKTTHVAPGNSEPDAETLQFMADLEQSLREAKAGVYAAVHTPEQILARRGRPVGTTKPNTKVAVKMRLDPDLVAALRASGRGWQTRANQILREQVFAVSESANSGARAS